MKRVFAVDIAIDPCTTTGQDGLVEDMSWPNVQQKTPELRREDATQGSRPRPSQAKHQCN